MQSVATSRPWVALTFDDGPDPATTPRYLDLLERHGARATFFMVGSQAERHPDLVATVRARGHAIGSHGWDHRSFVHERPGRPAAWLHAQLTRPDGPLGSVDLVRTPYGHVDLTTALAARRARRELVGWSCAAWDWQDRTAAAMADHVLDRLRPGSIVLFHDSLRTADTDAQFARDQSLAALERVLTAPTGMEFVTLPRLLSAGRIRRQVPGLRRTMATPPAQARRR